MYNIKHKAWFFFTNALFIDVKFIIVLYFNIWRLCNDIASFIPDTDYLSLPSLSHYSPSRFINLLVTSKMFYLCWSSLLYICLQFYLLLFLSFYFYPLIFCRYKFLWTTSCFLAHCLLALFSNIYIWRYKFSSWSGINVSLKFSWTFTSKHV